MKALLPQNDRRTRERPIWMERNREKYQYDHEYLPPVPVLLDLPDEEAMSAKYLAARVAATAELIPNLAAAKIKSIFDPFDEIQDFEDLFPILPKPTSMRTWRTDDSFAEQRLSGANPMKMRRVQERDELPFKLGGDGELLPGFSTKIGDALAAGRLFYSDYSDLSFIQGGTHEHGKKYLPTPKVIFFWQKSGYRNWGQLLPVAIETTPNASFLTPQNVRSPLDWLIAKLCVQIAHANHHELSTHLTRTHLVMGPFGIATARQLAENHPIGILLRPHFRFMASQVDLGQRTLLNRGGILDNLLAGTLEESLTVVTDAYKSWSVKEFSFPHELENRGLLDRDFLPHFPFRDDGMLLWKAIEKLVTGYVELYYRSEQDLIDDTELRAWAGELADPALGNVIDMPSPISTRQELFELLTNVIFTCGPQHSAVNFSQYDYMAHVPNMPLAAYCPVPGQNPVSVDARTAPALSSAENETQMKDLLMRFLPPAAPTTEQMRFAFILANYHYDRLGFYADKDFDDPEALLLIDQFKQELFQIERRIDLRNEKRHVPYKFLKPSEILNSISL